MEATYTAMMTRSEAVPRLVALHSKSPCALSRLEHLHSMVLPLLSPELTSGFILLAIYHPELHVLILRRSF